MCDHMMQVDNIHSLSLAAVIKMFKFTALNEESFYKGNESAVFARHKRILKSHPHS